MDATAKSISRRAATVILWILATLVMLIMTGWAVLMLRFSNLPWPWLRTAAAAIFAMFAIAMFIAIVGHSRRRWHAVGVFLLAWAALVIWFRLIPPSDSRNWQANVARPPHVAIDGDIVTIQNVRNFLYRSETDFDERWETRTFDLSKLDGHDLLCVYWGSPAIAHTMISFRFRDDSVPGGFTFLPISIEVRKEKAESYSTIAGFFRQYELYYVIADERDVVGLRTNHRGEEVFVYRTIAPPERSRRILVDYLKTADELSRSAKWYNALTDNCTNGILYHVRSLGGEIPITWQVVLSGYADQYAYQAGSFGHALPFDQLKRESRINDAAAGHDRDPDFSSLIRADLPGYRADASPALPPAK